MNQAIVHVGLHQEGLVCESVEAVLGVLENHLAVHHKIQPVPQVVVLHWARPPPHQSNLTILETHPVRVFVQPPRLVHTKLDQVIFFVNNLLDEG